MPKEKALIYWISHRPIRFECQHFNSISHLLGQHGFTVKWIEVLQDVSTTNAVEWASQHLPTDAYAVFFGGKELSWFKPIIAGARITPGSPLSLVPFFWIYEDVDHHLLSEMCDEGFDDFCHISIQPHELLLRLKLRRGEAAKRTQSDLAIREQNAKNAKSETIVKQREEFLGVCAHDLRSPLGLIQSSASLILKSLSEKHAFTPTHLELLNRIKRQATQAVGLVNDLLDVMSFEQGLKPQYQLFNLNDMLTEFYQDYKSQAEQKGVQFHYNNPVADWKILADADRVRQLLQNLVMNAIKFTEPQHNIFMNVSSFIGRRKSDPLYPMLVISIKDEGKGIPEKEIQKVFDRFSQLRDQSRGEGRGLGLTVAKQISNLHDGNIWVESIEGKGSTFCVLLPHAVSRTDSVVKPARKVPLVVVAEPSVNRRTEYFEKLEAMGLEVVYAKDGVEALGLLFHLLPDICILTAKLPKMEVLEIVDIAKRDALTATIPLFLAGEESEKLENHLDTHKFDRFLRLPLNEENFRTTLESVGKFLNHPQKKAA